MDAKDLQKQIDEQQEQIDRQQEIIDFLLDRVRVLAIKALIGFEPPHEKPKKFVLGD